MKQESCIIDSEWNTSGWNRQKIKAALVTLYKEVEHSEDEERRILAEKMIMRLLRNHKVAKDLMDEDLELLLPKSHGNIRKIGAVVCFRIARLVALITQEMGHKVSRDHGVVRSCAILNCEKDASCRIIQHQWYNSRLSPRFILLIDL